MCLFTPWPLGSETPWRPDSRCDAPWNLRSKSPTLLLSDLRNQMVLDENNWSKSDGNILRHMAVCQNLVPLVNIKIAGKWMFIPLKMVLIGIDPYPYWNMGSYGIIFIYWTSATIRDAFWWLTTSGDSRYCQRFSHISRETCPPPKWYFTQPWTFGLWWIAYSDRLRSC